MSLVAPSDPVAMPYEFCPESRPFFKKYNDRLEIPISLAASALIVTVLAFAGSILFYRFMSGSSAKPPLAITAVYGDADFGEGQHAATSGDQAVAPTAPPQSNEPLPSLSLPTIPQADAPFAADTRSDLALPELRSSPFDELQENLQKKSEKSDGKTDGYPKTGPGDDPNNARSRSMRWVMRFNVQDGEDYLNQLALMKAVIMIPIPKDEKSFLVFTEFGNGKLPKPNRKATAKEIERESAKMRFCDVTERANQDIGKSLGLSITPKCFFVFFPSELEKKRAKAEEDYKGRKANEIAETIYRITVKDGTIEFKVIEQTLKQ